MSKLYKAVDRNYPKNGLKCWLVNDKGVAISTHHGNDIRAINNCKRCEDILIYSSLERFSDAIDPVLIAEW